MMAAVSGRLWAMSLQAGILILIVLAARFFMRRYPRVYSYFLWSLVGLRLLCPVWVESPLSLQPDWLGYSDALQDPLEGAGFFGGRAGNIWGEKVFSGGGNSPDAGNAPSAQDTALAPAEGLDEGWNQADAAAGSGPDEDAGRILGGDSGEAADMAQDRNSEDMPGAGLGSGRRNPGRIYDILSIVYLTGAAAIALFYLIQYFRMRRRISTAVREKGNVWLCENIDSPFVMGVICPRIYLPYGLGSREKKHVLRHERVHLKHHDPLIRIMGTVCICLHWWNPLVWTAVHFMNQDMEMYCDETVLNRATLGERKDYARTLLSFAEKRSGLGTGLAFVESHTEKRVKNIMRKKRKKNVLIIPLVGILVVFCAVFLMTVPGRGEGEDQGQDTVGAFSQAGEEGGEASVSGSGDGTGAENAAGTGTGSGQMGGSSGGQGPLSDGDLSYLMEASAGIPDFTLREEMDAAFWGNYLFATYTSDFDREEVSRYSEQYGADIPYVRVSYEEADAAIAELFGEHLAGYGIDPEALWGNGSSLIYEEGDFFIAASDSPDYRFSVDNVTTTDILTEVSLLKRLGDGEVLSQVMLYLLPAENERGFVLDGKEELSVPSVPEGEALEGQSFDVEMNPYGRVTFAVYPPDLSVSPYADVSFRLLREGEEIYSFPLKGTGVREDQSVFEEMAAVAFPDLNGDGYTDVVTIANYQHESGPVPSQARIFTYNPGGYFLEERYLEEAFNESHETKTVEEIQDFADRPENQDYFVRTSIYGNWRVTGYRLPGIYSLGQGEIDSLVGTRLEYDRASMRAGAGTEWMEASYERSAVTAESLASDFRINAESLGLTSEEITSYTVTTGGDSLFGSFFYQTDLEHGLIYYEGVFFEAVRE